MIKYKSYHDFVGGGVSEGETEYEDLPGDVFANAAEEIIKKIDDVLGLES